MNKQSTKILFLAATVVAFSFANNDDKHYHPFEQNYKVECSINPAPLYEITGSTIYHSYGTTKSKV